MSFSNDYCFLSIHSSFVFNGIPFGHPYKYIFHLFLCLFSRSCFWGAISMLDSCYATTNLWPMPGWTWQCSLILNIGDRVGLVGFFPLPFTFVDPVPNPTTDKSLTCGLGFQSPDYVGFPFGVFLPHLKLNIFCWCSIHPVIAANCADGCVINSLGRYENGTGLQQRH